MLLATLVLVHSKTSLLKVAFIQKVGFVFQISKTNIPNHYPELEIWISCLLFLAENLNFKFRIVIWNICFGDLKNASHFLNKSYLYQGSFRQRRQQAARAYCPNIYTVPWWVRPVLKKAQQFRFRLH
jgi:hypothetical protein